MKQTSYIAYWLLVSIFLIFTFARGDGDYIKTIYFVTLLMPVAIGTSLFFNAYLIPRFLLTGKYLAFAQYFIYSLIFSLYFEMIVLTISFIVLANYRYENLNPYATNLLLLSSTIYLFVFINGFMLLIGRLRANQLQLDTIGKSTNQAATTQIVIKVDRKNVPVEVEAILYIESLGDYIKVVTNSKQYLTKEKISKIAERLPNTYLRVHRAFLINTSWVDSFSHDTMTVGGQPIPISRTYKKQALEVLGKSNV